MMRVTYLLKFLIMRQAIVACFGIYEMHLCELTRET